MRFASCQRGDERFAALVDGDRVMPLDGISELGRATDVDLLAAPPLVPGSELALDDVELLPVVPNPGKIICLGLNYRGHVTEAKRELPTYPVLFTKFAESLIGPYAPIVKPPESDRVDFEVELAVVIGRHVRRARGQAALDAIAGVTVANDVTMRDYQRKTHQWLPGKSWADTTPLGPFLVTPDEVDLAGGLTISLTVNGEEMQRSSTDRLIFDIPTVIERISEFIPLAPGDVILTGTPNGVGDFRDPPVYLRPGDLVRAEVEGVGVLENAVVAEESAIAQATA